MSGRKRTHAELGEEASYAGSGACPPVPAVAAVEHPQLVFAPPTPPGQERSSGQSMVMIAAFACSETGDQTRDLKRHLDRGSVYLCPGHLKSMS